jgi:phospholipid transport system substrate-binding protein
VLTLLQDAEFEQPARGDARRQQIRAIADEIFDWQETGKRALAPESGRAPGVLGPRCGPRGALLHLEDRAVLRRARGIRRGARGRDQATVRTKLITKSNTEIPVDYRMQKDGDRSRAYDVVIECVSLVSNYRTQFNRIIQQSGMASS